MGESITKDRDTNIWPVDLTNILANIQHIIIVNTFFGYLIKWLPTYINDSYKWLSISYHGIILLLTFNNLFVYKNR